MFEHVGLRTCTLLRRHPAAAQGWRHRHESRHHLDRSREPRRRPRRGEFIGKYVFRRRAAARLAGAEGNGLGGLEVMDVETLRLHYAKTLWHCRTGSRQSRRSAQARRREALRIWRTYLAGCAHAFDQRWVSIQQVLATQNSDPRASPLPLTRDTSTRAPVLPRRCCANSTFSVRGLQDRRAGLGGALVMVKASDTRICISPPRLARLRSACCSSFQYPM